MRHAHTFNYLLITERKYAAVMKRAVTLFLASALIASATSFSLPANESPAFAVYAEEMSNDEICQKNKENVLNGLAEMTFSNSITERTLEDLIIDLCIYGETNLMVWVENVNIKKATDTEPGLVTAEVTINRNSGITTFNIEKEIPIGGKDTESTVKNEITFDKVCRNIKEEFAYVEINNNTDVDDFLFAAKKVVPKDYTVELGEGSKKVSATKEKQGHITVYLTVTAPDETSGVLSYDFVIGRIGAPSEKAQIQAAKSAINDAIWKYEVSNNTTAADIEEMASSAIAEDSDVVATIESDDDFSLTKATTTLTGLVSVKVTLTCGNMVDATPVAKTIPEVVTAQSTAIEADMHEVSLALELYKFTNKTTAEDLLAVAKAAIKNGSSCEWETFNKKDADFYKRGDILGYMKFTLGEETRTVRHRFEIPMLVRKLPSAEMLNVSREEWEILHLTNIERYKDGKKLLTMPADLQAACATRKGELEVVYSHTRPNGKSCFTAIPGTFKYANAGENITQCTVAMTASRAVNSWMNSAGHRANMLKDNYQYMGTGVYQMSALQMFANQGDSIAEVTSSSGSFVFSDEDEMQKEYIICKSSNGVLSYVPIDLEYLERLSDGTYKLNLRSNVDVILKVDSTKISHSSSKFTDVPFNAYYADAVSWAVDKKITTGTSDTTFSPDNECTRAQIITFLWRAIGAPKNVGANPFEDVSPDDYYYDAAIWSNQMGMVPGNKFAANTPCTRADTVMYLWRNAGSPFVLTYPRFDDVPQESMYAQAVEWAYQNKITSGTAAKLFSPGTICSRAQIVTFLKRALG